MKIEVTYYTCKNSSYYIVSRTDSSNEYYSIYVDSAGYFTLRALLYSEGTARIKNTWIRAYPGWTYLVLNVEMYGIGLNKQTKIIFNIRNNNELQ